MKAPAVAEWLINHLIPESEASAIAGDLLEQWRAGRSRLWFWRQLLAAVVICIWRDIQTHKKVAMSGIAIGMVSLWGIAALTTVTLSSFGLLIHAVDWRWPHYIQLFTIAFTYTTASGWIVGRLHHTHRTTAVFAFFAFVITGFVWQLPLYYAVAPSIFFSTILPHLPFFVFASLLGAPSILIGGLSATPTVSD
jgi:hypothetical protein